MNLDLLRIHIVEGLQEQHSLIIRVFSKPHSFSLLDAMMWPTGFWFRVFGYGISFKKATLFSERNKLNEKAVYVGPFVLSTLTPDRERKTNEY